MRSNQDNPFYGEIRKIKLLNILDLNKLNPLWESVLKYWWKPIETNLSFWSNKCIWKFYLPSRYSFKNIYKICIVLEIYIFLTFSFYFIFTVFFIFTFFYFLLYFYQIFLQTLITLIVSLIFTVMNVNFHQWLENYIEF